jgi:hypothetical protein
VSCLSNFTGETCFRASQLSCWPILKAKLPRRDAVIAPFPLLGTCHLLLSFVVLTTYSQASSSSQMNSEVQPSGIHRLCSGIIPARGCVAVREAAPRR